MKFNFPAGTSRGVLREKASWFVFIQEDDGPIGIGEVSHIPGLSISSVEDIDQMLKVFCDELREGSILDSDFLLETPELRFGVETAFKDLERGGKRHLYDSEFARGERGIFINGLIWMDKKQQMLGQIKAKLDLGFKVLKLKVGAIDFSDELALIRGIRQEYSLEDLEIRLDANGAWEKDEALEKLDILSEYQIHSLEQPIRAGQLEDMAIVCKKSPIDIALDEELIGLAESKDKKRILETILPQYIILKPSLLGGFQVSEEWISYAESLGISWWITSALESNVGLNAIAQWTASLDTKLPQGLGTGQLFTNNISSPLEIDAAKLWHRADLGWDFTSLFNLVGLNDA